MPGFESTTTLTLAEFAVLCPLTVEWEAVRSRLAGIQDPADPSDLSLPSAFGKIGEHSIVCVKTGKGQVQPFEIIVDGKVVSRYNPDGSKLEFWRGFPVSRHEPENGSLIYETVVKYPVFASIDNTKTSAVLANAEPGSECNFKDFDGLIKKSIKQEDGRWTRVSDNSYLW